MKAIFFCVAGAVAIQIWFAALTYRNAEIVAHMPRPTRTVRVVEYQPSENVAVIGKYRCATHGGLIGYYVGLYQNNDFEVDCADHSSYTGHGGMKVGGK